MKFIHSIVFVLSILSISTASNAQNNSSNTEPYYLDTLHSNISDSVLDWSSVADITISKWLGYEDNATCTIIPEENTQKSKVVDSFFQNNKYLNETDDVFIRVRTDYTLSSKTSNHFRLKFRAQLPFSRCRQQIKLFVEDMSLNKEEKRTTFNEDKSTDIGIRYIDKIRHGIKSRYSLGLSGIKPFVEARYNLQHKVNSWEIDTVQTFKYSTKDYFEEETTLYFDKPMINNSLFRFTLLRGTKSQVDGMHYGSIFEYYFNAKENSGLRLSQAFFGHTKYRSNLHNVKPKNDYHGINNYVTSLSYRANIWRKWFYYELRPSVSFHKDYDYEPNYSIGLFFDFYFGKYN